MFATGSVDATGAVTALGGVSVIPVAMIDGGVGGGGAAGGHSMMPAIAPVLSASIIATAKLTCLSFLI